MSTKNLQDALAYAEKHQPAASIEKKRAFTNSVVRLIGEDSRPLNSPDGLIFSLIQEVHREVIKQEIYLDNNPEDTKE